MVGSLGEVLAATKYEINLLRPNTRGHDATTSDGRSVQIRTTQRNSIPLKKRPDYLLAIKLNRNASIEEIFNGPGEIAWQLTRNRRTDPNGGINIQASKLKELNRAVPEQDKIRLR